MALADLFKAVEQGPLLDDEAGEPAPGCVHIVQSAGANPYANLAVEQRLLEHSHPASRVLFLYHNAPCVVIGRNQNPWAEVNLAALASSSSSGVRLVRRRSGGGAVYHDTGNANWSVLGPSADFNRDFHALMVSRALQRLGIASRVNERHDIVVDESTESTFKVSGSAYRLTRHRFLHHGTCLLGADLSAVSGLLHSPAAAYVRARGVASVRSPVRNVLLGQPDARTRFAAAVADEFAHLYGPAVTTRCTVDVDAAAAEGFSFDKRLAKGYTELMTRPWLYGQTPQFTFSTLPTDEDDRARPPRPPQVPPQFQLSFTARHGELQDVRIQGLPYNSADAQVTAAAADFTLGLTLNGQHLHAISDWHRTLAEASLAPLDTSAAAAIGAWLDRLLCVAP